VKVSHHGSDNSFDAAILAEVGGGGVFGMSTGRRSKSHPDRAVIDALTAAGVVWVRTDRNGHCIVELPESGEELTVAEGQLNDASPPGVPPG
jgi:beta-lactamase superfamily II metal-dependent hydrolase